MSLQYLRSFRIHKIALFDLVCAVIGLYLLLKFLFPNKSNDFYMAWTLVLVFPVSITAHLIFGVPTQLNNYLFN